jgi:antitoxin (DNA-binding transcriptional repressor) of toxin-antitoxin stability system
MQVTARELKLRLGRYLQVVRGGETVRVTHRGSPIAEIRSVPATSNARLKQLVAEGRVTPGRGKLPPHTPAPARRSGTALILADRAAEDAPSVANRLRHGDRPAASDHRRVRP